MNIMEFSNATVIPDANHPDAFLYVPKIPAIAAGPDGKPQFNLLTAGPVSFLQLTGSWGLNHDEIAVLRKELATRTGLSEDILQLQPAPCSVHDAALLLGDEAGSFTVLQQSKSSGVPPYHAAFNVMLNTEQLQTVRDALGGKRGLLAFRYDIRFRLSPAISSMTEWLETSRIRSLNGNNVTRDTGSCFTETRTTGDAAGEIMQFYAQLDAADWNAAR